MKKSAEIKSLNGLKVIAVLMIFWQHCVLYRTPIPDQAARAVEIFFVVSGFLTAYNHFNDDFSLTWKESFDYTLKRIMKFWPLHVSSFLLYSVFVSGKSLFGKSNIIKAFLNVFLLQAWSPNPDVYFSFNGASWYLSALVFCYFITPLLMWVIKRAGRPIALFMSVFAARFALSYLTVRFSGEFFRFETYTFPPSRCLEYFMGMAILPLFLKVKEKCEICAEHEGQKKKECLSFWSFSLLEIGCVFLACLVFFSEPGYWFTPVCVLAICLMVFVLALEKGLISAFLSLHLFELFSSIQLEFFMLHVPVIHILQKYGKLSGYLLPILVSFTGSLLLSWLYHHFLADRFFRIMKKMLCNYEKK